VAEGSGGGVPGKREKHDIRDRELPRSYIEGEKEGNGL